MTTESSTFFYVFCISTILFILNKFSEFLTYKEIKEWFLQRYLKKEEERIGLKINS